VRNINLDMRRQVENERLRLELAHAGRMILGHLTASLAHDLKQPIAAVVSNAEAVKIQLARGAYDPRELGRILEEIIASALRAGGLIERVQGRLGKDPRAYQRLDLNSLAHEISKTVHNELTGRQVSLVLELAPSLPPVLGDPIELKHAMLSLLMNGAEAMSETLPSNRALVLRTLARADKVQFSVCDRGPGLSAADLEHLFEPFFSTKPAALGMGLFISSGIVRAHGGELFAERLEGGGMHFYFALPEAS
jgi:signal transduction histidine kinase